MCGLAGEAMERATQALLQADLALAEQVITDHERIADDQRARRRSRVHAAGPAGAGGRRPASHRQRRSRSSPTSTGWAPWPCTSPRSPAAATPSTLPEEVNGYFAEMGRVAVELSRSAQEVLETLDPEKAARIREEDDAMDDLHRHLFSVLMDREWKHGVTAAVDVTLLSRFYERFADHAVEVARRVIFHRDRIVPERGSQPFVEPADRSRRTKDLPQNVGSGAFSLSGARHEAAGRCSPRWPSGSGWRRSSRCRRSRSACPGLPVASQVEERGLVADPGGLLHVVRDDHDR